MVSCLFLASAFCSSDWVVMAYEVLLAVWAVLAMLIGLMQCACHAMLVVSSMSIICFQCVALACLQRQYVDFFTAKFIIAGSFFAQHDHLSVSRYVIHWLCSMKV